MSSLSFGNPPSDLVVTFNPDGTAVESRVPLSGNRLIQWLNDQTTAQQAQQVATLNAQTIQNELQTLAAQALALADALDANTATPAQQRQALSMCLRGIVRLGKVVYRDYAQAA